ncbi:hypothetical protein GJAV_G00190850 [Gymnothorax javanicus]|nr:hypothetical protein GJAV_G00190850 [Gymnothorax javanicus]
MLCVGGAACVRAPGRRHGCKLLTSLRVSATSSNTRQDQSGRGGEHEVVKKENKGVYCEGSIVDCNWGRLDD